MRRLLALFATMTIAACSTPVETESGSAALASATCELRDATFGSTLFDELRNALGPSFSTTQKITVPGALTATIAPDGSTHVITVLAATQERSSLDIMGESPDLHHADRTAHRIYDALTRAQEDDLGRRVSANGLVTCTLEGWKGGTLYHCTFNGLETAGEVSLPSSICQP
jgi:hypothetical protein